jgi:hypothetical protein
MNWLIDKIQHYRKHSQQEVAIELANELDDHLTEKIKRAFSQKDLLALKKILRDLLEEQYQLETHVEKKEQIYQRHSQTLQELRELAEKDIRQ